MNATSASPATRIRRCIDCRLVKTLDFFLRDRHCPDGRRNLCLECHRDRQARRTVERRSASRPTPAERAASVESGEKWCNNCGRFRTFADFTSNVASRDGLDHRCRECHRDERAMERYAEVRACILEPNLLDVCDRSERRADLAEIGGARGARAFRERFRIIQAIKAARGGLDIPPELLAAALPDETEAGS